jgi:C4-dicarboxylate transporter DctM subunit
LSVALGLVPAVLLLLGFPLYLVLLTASCVALVFFMNIPYAALQQNLFGAIDVFALLAVPFFIYAGELMGRGSVARRIVDLVQAGAGPLRGSLGVTAVGTSVVFGAISGAAAATVATVGRIMLPALRAARYPERVTAGLLTAVGAIDIVIPPSIPMIVYGASANESIPRLYAAGVVPGLLIAALLAAYVVLAARRGGYDPGTRFDARALARAFARSLWALGAPVIILGGIYGGIFSPTESAAAACVYAALVTRLVYREVPWSEVVACAAATVRITAQILVIVACASVYSWLLTVQQVPQALVGWVAAQRLSAAEVLLAINLLLLAVGCFVDALSAILVLTPLLVPLARSLGIDTVHLGVIMAVNLAIGLFTPPFGINIFVAQSALKLDTATIYAGLAPFVLIYVAVMGVRLFLTPLVPPGASSGPFSPPHPGRPPRSRRRSSSR